MKRLYFAFATFASLALCSVCLGAPRMVTLPGKSPIITFRIVFTTGSASDPAGQAGVANLTAQMLARGGTRDMPYQKIVDAMFPMAASVSTYIDKEMMTFTAETHADNLEKFYQLFRAMLLQPGWRPDDFKRLKDDAINNLRVTLRGNNDEELAKEELYNALYAGQPYGHENLGTVSDLEKMTMDDLQRFYANHLTQANVIIGLAGGYPADFPDRVKKDFERLRNDEPVPIKIPAPPAIDRNRAVIIQKDTRSVAYSFGFPIDVKRGDPDYPALLVMQAFFGPHRSEGQLYERMRELRGLNYGDYDYIEYFPRGMFKFEPDPNLARQQQIFQIWIRPVEPATAVFSLRLAFYELDKLVKNGLTPEQFERTRSFLSKYVNILTKTKSAELGYAIDSLYYGIPNYNSYVKTSLAKLTLNDVNQAIRRHMRADRLQIVAVAKDADGLRTKLLSPDASPMAYNSPKPDDVMKEDKVVERWPVGLRSEDIRIIPADRIFE
ncbi:MAG: insulinase family protein [Acidobacteriota bacterium]|nr:insulinase family protein [Acidobacteriota bacterium]